MKFYSVTTDSPEYFPTRHEAVGRAKTWSLDAEHLIGREDGIAVDRLEIPTDRANVLRLLNLSGGFVETSEIVATFKHGKRVTTRTPTTPPSTKDGRQ